MVPCPRCPPGARGLLALLLLLLLLPVPGARGSCGAPPSFSFARLSRETRFSSFPTGHTLRYSCLPGYALGPGKSTYLTCLSNSAWSENAEFCVGRPCPPLRIVNGRVDVTDFRFGAKANFSCDEGYRLIGTTSAQCVLTKYGVEWDKEVPLCQDIRCLPPPDITKGSHNGLRGDEFSFGSAVTYKCDQGLSLIGEASIHCTTKDNVNGEWSGSAPECKVQCPKPEVQNGRMVNALDEKMWYSVNETIPFTCSPEYQFSSPSRLPATDRFSITCLADGSWTALPKCKKQSASDVCAVVPESKEFLDCDVPLEQMKTLLELQKIYLEIEKLKQELKLQ